MEVSRMPTETTRPARPPSPPAARAPNGPGLDRLINDPTAVAKATRASEARALTGRRRLVDPTTCERDYTAAEVEFMQAMQEYKRKSGRMFPTWSEVLEVLQALGYEKAAAPTGLFSPSVSAGGAS
jgi:hypothetical protein